MAKLMRLDKYLVEMNKGSRTQIKDAAKKGRIQVNGVPEKKTERKIDPETDEVTFDSQAVSYRAMEYIMLYKPAPCMDNGGATKTELETVVQLLNPFAPHMTEELWEKLGHGHDEQLAYYPWPKYEEAKCVESTVEIAVQVNGKVKARLKVAADIDAAAAIAAAKADPAVAAALEGKQLVKEIYVKGRLVNLAVKG